MLSNALSMSRTRPSKNAARSEKAQSQFRLVTLRILHEFETELLHTEHRVQMMDHTARRSGRDSIREHRPDDIGGKTTWRRQFETSSIELGIDFGGKEASNF